MLLPIDLIEFNLESSDLCLLFLEKQLAGIIKVNGWKSTSAVGVRIVIIWPIHKKQKLVLDQRIVSPSQSSLPYRISNGWLKRKRITLFDFKKSN